MVYMDDVKDLIDFVPNSMRKKKAVNKSDYKLMFYEFAYLIMKNPFSSNTIEMLSGLIRIVQLISIPLNQDFISSWTDNKIFQITSTFINYFNLLPLLQGSSFIFLVVFYLCIVIVIFLFILAMVCMNVVVNQQQSESAFFFLFKTLLITCSSFLYVPMLRIFLGFFYSLNSSYVFYNQYDGASPFRIIHDILGIVFALALVLFSLIIQSVLFEIKYSKERKYAKTTSKVDIEVILGQTFLVILTIFFDDEWVILFFSCVISIVILWDYILLKPFFYAFLTKIFMVYYTTYAWCNIVLFLCKVLNDFDGGLVLFGVGIPFIALCSFFSHDQSIDCIMKTINKCESGPVALKHVIYLTEIIDAKDSDRRAKILTDGYIHIFEENCHIANCPLHKYLSLSEDKKYRALLYQHVESVYRIAIKRYPTFVKLKLSFATYLNETMHKKTGALEVLKQNSGDGSDEEGAFSIEDDFLLYRYRRNIEEDAYGLNNSNTNNKNFGNNKLLDKNNASMLNFSYKSKFTGFKKEMANVSALYVEFWNLLMTEGSEAEKLLKLNNLGTKITEKVEECELLFQKLQKINPVDYEVLFYYSEFLRNVTNKSDIADKYKEQYEKILQTTTEDDKEETFLSVINTKEITKTDEYQFIIVSSNPGTFGCIQNISLGFCILLGYTREELIGKNVNIMIPELIHKAHVKILTRKLDEFKHSELDKGADDSEMPSFRTLKTFAVDKAKYLVEVSIRVGIFHSEVYGNAFICRTCENYGMNLINNDNKCCYVLTNSSFAIQSFTTTAVSMLGLNSNFINCGIDMTKLIKQFYEEFFRIVGEKELQQQQQAEMNYNSGYSSSNYNNANSNYNSHLTKAKVLKDIAEKNFSKPTLVNFRNIDENFLNNINSGSNNFLVSTCVNSPNVSYNLGMSYGMNKSNVVAKNSSFTKRQLSATNDKNAVQSNNNNNNDLKRKLSSKNSKIAKTQFEMLDEALLLSITKLIVLNQHRGYFFKFEKPNSGNGGVSSMLTSNLLSSFDASTLKNQTQQTQTQRQQNQLTATGITPGLVLPSFKDSGTIPGFDFADATVPKFVIDPDKMSYVLNKGTAEQSREQLRQLALSKVDLNKQFLQTQKQTKNEGSENDSNASEEDEDDDEYTDSEDENASKRNGDDYDYDYDDDSDMRSMQRSVASSEVRREEQRKKEKKDSYEMYYKVDFTNIKFMIYDFNKKVFVTHPYEKYSKVDRIINERGEEKDEKELSENLSENNTNLNIDGNTKDPAKSAAAIEAENKSTAHQIIEYTLSKKETQPALFRLKIFSFSTFVLILVFLIVWFIFINSLFINLRNNFRMINLSYNTIMNGMFAICNVRQLTLLSNENYTGYIQSRELDFEYTLDDLAKIYTETHQLMKDITTSSIGLTKEHKAILDSEQVTISIYDSEKNIKNSYYMTLQSCIFEGNTALRHIITDLTKKEEFIPLETNIYFYLENSIKGIYTAELRQVETFEEEFKFKVKSYKTWMLIIVLMNIPVLLGCYGLIVVYFRRTTKRKEEYLIIFFDIGINVIKCLLQNCEDFSNKIQCESILDFFNEEMSVEHALGGEELSNGNNAINNINNVNNMNMKSKKNHLQHTDVSSQENLHLELLLSAFFIAILLINILIFYFTNQINKSFGDFIEVFKTQISNNNEYLMLMINIREYCFGTMTYMGIDSIDNDVTKYLELFQEKALKTRNNDLEEKAYSGPFANIIYNLYQGNVCETNKEYITMPEGMNCEDILYNAGKYGFTVLLSSYFTQLRAIKSQMEYLYLYAAQNKFEYNMTLAGTIYEMDKLPKDPSLVDKYYELHPMIVFNSEPFLSVIKAYRYVIRGCIGGLFKTFTKEINSYITENVIIMNLVLGGFALFVLCAYFGVWVRYEQKLNNTIYKTKNMLSIIPVTILANIPSVFKVLEINSMIKANEKKNVDSNVGKIGLGLLGVPGVGSAGSGSGDKGKGNSENNNGDGEGGNAQQDIGLDMKD